MNSPSGQKVDYLRLAVTDRCNYRCVYCMPPEGAPFKPHEDMLTYEDMAFFVGVAVQTGIRKVRLTGGEPLVRKGVPDLVAMLKAIPDIWGISLTTNGVLLPQFAEELKAKGLDRVNISLDSLDPERYRQLTRGGDLQAVLAGVEAALQFALSPSEAQRGHDAGVAARTAGLRGAHSRATPACALYRVDAGGRMRAGRSGRAAEQGRPPGRPPEAGSSERGRSGQVWSRWLRLAAGGLPSTIVLPVTRVRWVS